MTSDPKMQDMPLDSSESGAEETKSRELLDSDDPEKPWIPPGQSSLSLNLLEDDLLEINQILASSLSEKTLSQRAFLFEDSEAPTLDSSSAEKSDDNAFKQSSDSSLSAGKDETPGSPKEFETKEKSETHEVSSKEKQDDSDKPHDTDDAGEEEEKLLEDEQKDELPPDIRQFEGTNEIYVHSGVFDAMLEDEENAKKRKAGKLSLDEEIKLSHEVHLKSKNTDDSNVIGIISSGILPSVEIDKSFESPCIEENGIEFGSINLLEDDLKEEADDDDGIIIADEPTQIIRSQSEVFVSRISQDGENAKIERPSQEGLRPAPKAGIKVLPENAYGLPLPESPETIHPEDNALISSNAIYRQFAIEHICDSKLTEIFGQETDDDGLEVDIKSIMAALADMSGADHPRAIQLVSDCRFAFNRLMRALVQNCADDLSDFYFYATALPEQECYLDIPTALMASRIGCFPGDSEDIRRKYIHRGVNHIFDSSLRSWAMDILSLRFGMPKMVVAQKDISKLKSRSPIDILSVLLKAIESDAQKSPVFIVLSEDFTTIRHPWRDVIRQIKTLNLPNILILVQTNEKSSFFSDEDTFTIGKLQSDDCLAITQKILKKYNLSNAVITRIASLATNSFTSIRRTLYTLRSKFDDENQLNEELETFSSYSENARDNAYLESFSDDQKSFLCFGSLLGPTFFLEDLIRIYALEPLPDEPYWSHEERRKWAKRVSHELIERGELYKICEYTGLGGRFFIPEWKFIASRMFANEPETARRICGCYAHLLIRRRADDSLIALTFEHAEMWSDAAQYWLKVIPRMMNAFGFRSAHSIIAHRFEHIGPENDQLYQSLLEKYISLAICLGKYSEAARYAEMLLHLGFMLNDTKGTCRGLILLGDAQRLLGDYDSAADNLQNAIQFAQEIRDSRLLGSAYHHAAKLMHDAGENGALVGALRYTEKALEIMRRDRDLPAIATTLVTCAQIYLSRGEPDRAIQVTTEAYNAMAVSGLWAQLPMVYCSYARCYTELHQDNPNAQLEKALSLIELSNIREHQYQFLVTSISIHLESLQKKAVRDSVEQLRQLIQQFPMQPWIANYQLLKARFDFSRKNYQKTTKSLKIFFDTTNSFKNSYLISLGYALSAELNYEVYKRDLGKISIEKTHKLFRSATGMLENIGAWHAVAEVLRKYANFLEFLGEKNEAENNRIRANKVDPYSK